MGECIYRGALGSCHATNCPAHPLCDVCGEITGAKSICDKCSTPLNVGFMFRTRGVVVEVEVQSEPHPATGYQDYRWRHSTHTPWHESMAPWRSIVRWARGASAADMGDRGTP